ncbi:dCTP deaminase [Synechococcus sp. PCC 6312]|uniref:dCTP deaminase n=1 Tax=Synechococcus sp. (strain ATCC 27167 / PCC 6312) TaxID=195253 RepID=UPI00030FA80C|nr:dCTP deaminase [Synechococcus sp. PCC 6312]
MSNLEILAAISRGEIFIDNLANYDPAQPPFNTTSVDLRLSSEIVIPTQQPVALSPSKGGIASFLSTNSQRLTLTNIQPYTLKPSTFILGRTIERVAFPINEGGNCYAARVEGKSSLARCGVLVHFTAPTIHAGFEGTITLEIINLGVNDIQLTPDTYIYQLIIEEVKGIPTITPSQFRGQNTASGITT